MKVGDLGVRYKPNDRAELVEVLRTSELLCACRLYSMAKDPNSGRFFLDSMEREYTTMPIDHVKPLNINEIDFESLGKHQQLMDKVTKAEADRARELASQTA